MPRKTRLTATTRGKHPATAEHYKDGPRDVVKIGNLRVLVIRDGSWWLAQGLEIDYAAQGTSLDDVKEKFLHGLAGTAHAYLDKFGSIERFLRPASADALRELAIASERKMLKLSSTTEHEMPLAEPMRQLPFSGISFFERCDPEPALAMA